MSRSFSIAFCLILATLADGIVGLLHAGDDSPKQLPPEVSAIVSQHLDGGHVDDIKVIRIDERTLYVVKIDLPGPHERKVHVTGDGILLKTVQKVRLPDLPAPVRATVDGILAKRGRFDGADRVTADEKVEYHIELDLPGRVELELVLSDTGEVISRREERKL